MQVKNKGKNLSEGVTGTSALDAARHDEPEKKFEGIDPGLLPPQKAVDPAVRPISPRLLFLLYLTLFEKVTGARYPNSCV